jgi:hypothetical protein
MTPTTRMRRLGAALLLPFVLLLAGCGKLTADFDIKDENSYDLKLDFALDKSIAQDQLMIGSADEFCGELNDESDEFGDAELESYEKDDMWGCKVSGTVTKDGFGDGFDIAEEGDQLHLSIEGDSDFDTSEYDSLPGAGDFDFSMTFSFPGKVSSSNVGDVKGKTVTITSPNDLVEGVDIYAENKGSAVGIIIAVIVVLLLIVLLIVAAVVIFLVVRNKKKNDPQPPAAFGAAPGGPGNVGPYGPSGPPAGGPTGYPGQSQPYQGSPNQPLAPDTPQWNPAPQPGQSAPSPQQPGGQQTPWGQPPQAPQQGSPQQTPWGQPPQPPQQGSPQQPPQAQPWDQRPPEPGQPQDPPSGGQ